VAVGFVSFDSFAEPENVGDAKIIAQPLPICSRDIVGFRLD